MIIPLETKNRELHAKTLLALHAAERGWGVVIGDKAVTRVSQALLPRGVFVEKSISYKRIQGTQGTIDIGNRIASWSEEGLIYLNALDYKQRKLGVDTFDLMDFFFAWGQNEANDIMQILNRGPEKIVISGNPRFDLLRPEWRGVFAPAVQRIKEEYGPIILINTKFVTINHNKVGSERLAKFKEQGVFHDTHHEEMWKRIARVEYEIFDHFVRLLPLLSQAFPEHTIVVRPHPSEDNGPWEKAAEGLSNVKVVYQGAANEWILASDVTIQNNCTTGVESFLLGRPAISYRPYKDEEAEYTLPNKLSFEATNEDELVGVIHRILGKDKELLKDYERQLDVARHYIGNVEGKTACEAIVDALETLPVTEVEGVFPIRGSVPTFYLRYIARSVKKFLRSFNETRARRYRKKKFPGLSQAEMEEVLKNFQDVSGRFTDLEIRQIDHNGFCIYRP